MRTPPALGRWTQDQVSCLPGWTQVPGREGGRWEPKARSPREPALWALLPVGGRSCHPRGEGMLRTLSWAPVGQQQSLLSIRAVQTWPLQPCSPAVQGPWLHPSRSSGCIRRTLLSTFSPHHPLRPMLQPPWQPQLITDWVWKDLALTFLQHHDYKRT